MRIETERLLLRPTEPDDLDQFAALHSDPEVTAFVRPIDLKAAEERLKRDKSEWEQRGHGLFAVIDRQTGNFLGRCGLKYWPQFDETEVGWVLRREAWGRGYAVEAGRACIEWGFSTFAMPYLTAMISPGNVRSFRVAERLGFQALRRDDLLGEGVTVYAVRRPW